MPWKIKQNPEDFVVREVIFDTVESSWKEKYRQIRGHKAQAKTKYLWFTLCKKDYDFFRVIAELGKKLGISTKDIGYSGTKDKKAVTYQTISVPIDKEGEVKALKIPGVDISELRPRNRPIKLGEHKGNDFEITIRNLEESESSDVKKRLETMKKIGFVNYFGEQRFGSKKANDKVGRLLVLGDIEGAAKKIMDISREYERKMSAYLEKKPRDYEGALRQIPLRLLKIFIHAYQARIWNECARRYEGENTPIPVIGHRTDVRNYPRVRGILEEVLDEEKIGPGDFSNKSFKELSSRGSERDYRVIPEKLEHELKEGVLRLQFFLPKGSYATELVRQLRIDL
ncbi:MAG: tRNA pseudouridine(13) synthase TruD [Candidatus Aenigmatarchaeota archaeon]|nr:MAG: tRNA pseudouridine(13) synthase TruD [Candidatus Aenigmarchaeota archaeon]